MRARNAVAMAALLVAACAGRDLWPAERIDPKTAVNVTLMAAPWVYAREVPMLAANARDYLNLGIAETNRAGTRAYWLCLVSWSTIDRAARGLPGDVLPARIRLGRADGRWDLSPAAGGRAATGLGAPAFTEPVTNYTEAWYAISAAQVLQLASAAPVTVSIVQDTGEPSEYRVWRVDGAVLEKFVKATGLVAPGVSR